MHALIWPRPATYSEISDAYVKYVEKRYKPRITSVVFDGYDGPPSTKSMEQKRRSAKKTSANIVVNPEDFATTPKDNFLGNNLNKSLLIKLVQRALTRAGYAVLQSESDADSLIVRTALRVAEGSEVVAVVATDTDILSLLLDHSPCDSNISQIIPGPLANEDLVHNITNLQKVLGHAKGLMLFIHSMSGCDTTSAFFGKGKTTALNLIRSNKDLAEKMKIFYKGGASISEIAAAGEEFILAMYNGLRCKTLDELRVLQYKRTVGKQKLDDTFDFRTLPPSSSGAEPHSQRVYLQVRSKAFEGATTSKLGIQISKINAN